MQRTLVFHSFGVCAFAAEFDGSLFFLRSILTCSVQLRRFTALETLPGCTLLPHPIASVHGCGKVHAERKLATISRPCLTLLLCNVVLSLRPSPHDVLFARCSFSQVLLSSDALLRDVCMSETGAGLLPGVALPLAMVPAHQVSTSTSAAAQPVRDDAARTRPDGVVSPAPLIKVGDSGMWNVFEDEQLLGMHRTKLLETLVRSTTFGNKLKDVDISGCRVSVFKRKLASGKKVPTEADERDASKFVELEGAEPVSSLAKDITEGDQVCILVSLPTMAPVASPGERFTPACYSCSRRG